MFIIKIITLTLLLLIFLQDWKNRTVYWLLFPLLTALLTGVRFQHSTVLPDLMHSVLINVGFIIIQLVILTFYFSIKNRKWINVTIGLLGLGDILFLLSIAFYLSVLNFLFFYLVSLITVLLIWLPWQAVSRKRQKYIPLAGFQSLIFMLFLASDWWLRSFDLTNDTWLLNLIAK